MKKILVTGANGYLGTGIVKCLCDDGNNIISVCHSKKYKIDKRSRVWYGDVFEVENPMVEFGYPDILLHLAWKDGFIHDSESHINDLHKHVNLINKFAKAGIKKICIVGTMHEIGYFNGEVNELTPTNPITFYGIAKGALRNSSKIICEKNDVIWQWLRAYYIIGNTGNGMSIFSKIIRAEKKKEKFFPFTSCENKYDFIDYEQFCQMVAKTIQQDRVNGIINVCSGKPQKISDVVETFIKENKLSIKLDYGRYQNREYDSKIIWGNNSKIKDIMGVK